MDLKNIILLIIWKGITFLGIILTFLLKLISNQSTKIFFSKHNIICTSTHILNILQGLEKLYNYSQTQIF